jgi:hypothetical protein
VIISRDGKTKVGYLSTRQKKVDWNGLARVLRRDYKRNATTAVKKINQLLSQYDAIDSRKKEVRGSSWTSSEGGPGRAQGREVRRSSWPSSTGGQGQGAEKEEAKLKRPRPASRAIKRARRAAKALADAAETSGLKQGGGG